MSEASFRKDLITFLVEASKKDESYYGYVNPHLLSQIVSGLYETASCEEDDLEMVSDWANEYWGW